MKIESVQHALLRVASLLAPKDRRSEWLEEWRSELWYVPQSDATRFCMGAFADAFWLMRNSTRVGKRPLWRLESPFHCLAFLAAAAAFCLWMGSHIAKTFAAKRPHDAAFGQMVLLYLGLAFIVFAVGEAPGRRNPALGSGKMRGWVFLALKFLFLLPILQGIMIAVFVFVPSFGLTSFAATALLFRWAFVDQRRRCPVCLRLLTRPVVIGNSSQTLLDWYGAESLCSRGHGLLHVPEISANYCCEQWLTLDDAWSGLAAQNGGARRC